MPIHLIIADDEPLARQAIHRIVRTESDIDVVAEYATGDAATRGIAEHSADVVLLDIQMPGLNGFEVAEAVQRLPRPPILVFVTAHDEFALRAFRVHAFDYLLKPVDPSELRATLQRVRVQLQERNSAVIGQRLTAMLADLGKGGRGGDSGVPYPGLGAATRYLQRIGVPDDERVFFIRAEDVNYFEAARNYVLLRVGKQTFQIRETLTRLESQLDPHHFARIHRKTIVNVDRIRELQPWFTGDCVVILQDGTQLRLSRSYRSHLDAVLSGTGTR